MAGETLRTPQQIVTDVTTNPGWQRLRSQLGERATGMRAAGATPEEAQRLTAQSLVADRSHSQTDGELLVGVRYFQDYQRWGGV